MWEKLVEEQIYQILTYVQREFADMWKKNILADLELGDQKFILAEELLAALKEEFGKGDNKFAKVVELKQLEQDTHTMDEFI